MVKNQINEDIEFIKKMQKEISLLNQAVALLDWDQKTYMPKLGLAARAEQLSFLATLVHEKFTSKELFAAVERLKKEKLEGDDKLMVNKLYKQISKSKKLPKEFVEELTRQTAIAASMWEQAKEKSNFSIFQPYLEKLVELKRKQAELTRMPGHVYNTLIDDFEEGMTVEKLKPIFEKLKKDIIDLLRIIEKTKKYNSQKYNLAEGKFPKDVQIEVAKDVSHKLGLSDDFSRLDLSVHPFSTMIGANDTRITTGVRNDPMFSLGSTIHETGHALYNLGIPKELEYTVLFDSPSYGMHESQSRFWENMIGLNKSFWKFYFPELQKRYKLEGKYEDWYNEVNFAFPGMIRIESDEVHYCLHIILRFELETSLLDGSIKVNDLPKIWNQKMKEYFGKEPEDDAQGVLQDTHWAIGAFGYFPSYAIGTIYAAQIFEAMKKDLPVEKLIEKGEFSSILAWLREKIHKQGARILADDLIKNICGTGLNPEDYIKYLRKKYSEIYGFD